ncbi:MAG: hypothetical protein ACI9YL_000585 [Luteibaculaceae bacterium]|jgi:hypothetical protein
MKKGLITLVCSVLMLSVLGQKNPFKPNGANHFKDGVTTNWIPGSYTEYSYNSGNQMYTPISKHILEYEGYQLKSDLLLDANGGQALTRTDYEYFNDGGSMQTLFDVSGFVVSPISRQKFKENLSGGLEDYYMYWMYDQGTQEWVIEDYDSAISINSSGEFLGHELFSLDGGIVTKTEYSELVRNGNSAVWTFYEDDGNGTFSPYQVYEIEYINNLPTKFVTDDGSGSITRLTIPVWNDVLTFAPKEFIVESSTNGGQSYEFVYREVVEIAPNEKVESSVYQWNGMDWDLENKSTTRFNPLNGVYLSSIYWNSFDGVSGDSLISTVDTQGRIMEEISVQFDDINEYILGKKVYAEHSLDVTEQEPWPEELAVFPNPTQGEIKVLNAGTQKFSLTDITGKTWPVSVSSNGTIDLSVFPSGVYFLRDSKGRSARVVKLEE